MSDFVELWIYLSATPLFGLTASLSVYVMAHALYARLHQTPIANPVLWSVIVLAGVLHFTNTPYQTYFSGAQFIHFLLGPAVVALAWPLWERRVALKKRASVLIVAALAGGSAAALSAVALGHLLGLPDDRRYSSTCRRVCRDHGHDWSAQREVSVRSPSNRFAGHSWIRVGHRVAWYWSGARHAGAPRRRSLCRPGVRHSGDCGLAFVTAHCAPVLR